jgi:ubiquinol-cytochrome c reductase cytochrome b subunit
MMGTGFIGYVLPWGQMSLWGATVITNLVSAVPVVGKNIVEWLWGGFSVDNATLNRFFSLHYLLPFVIAGMSLVHLVLLHIDGSSNALGVDTKVDKIGFYPYCYVKDLFGFLIMFGGLGYLVFFNPNVLGHSDNYILADSMKTPEHIVPEWYFLPFYAILRTITHKLGGVVAMVFAIVGLMLLPYINTGEVRSSAFRPLMRKLFWLFVVDCILLGWIGQKAVDYPYQEVGQVLGLFYFMFLFVMIPGVSRFEVSIMRNK